MKQEKGESLCMLRYSFPSDTYETKQRNELRELDTPFQSSPHGSRKGMKWLICFYFPPSKTPKWETRKLANFRHDKAQIIFIIMQIRVTPKSAFFPLHKIGGVIKRLWQDLILHCGRVSGISKSHTSPESETQPVFCQSQSYTSTMFESIGLYLLISGRNQGR